MPKITLEQYVDKHVNTTTSKDYIFKLAALGKGERLIESGMIKWNRNEAGSWGGPWKGNYALFVASDHTMVYKLPTQREVEAGWERYATYSQYNFPYRISKDLNRSVTYLQRKELISQLTEQELIEYERKVHETYQHCIEEINFYPTIERPYRLYMCGNDDMSMSTTFEREEEMLTAIKDITDNPTFATLDKYGFGRL